MFHSNGNYVVCTVLTTLVLFISGLPGTCSGQLTPIPERFAPDQANNKLRALESSATFRAVKSSAPLSSKEYMELVKAAHSYAATVADKDDAQYARLATAALAKAVAAKRGLLGNPTFTEGLQTSYGNSQMVDPSERFAAYNTRTLIDSSPLQNDGLAQQIWESPSVQKNYRVLMERAATTDSGLFPITGPPSLARIVGPGTQLVGAESFRDCVCVGRRVGMIDQFCCTGTLVGKNVVVTAGHCFFCTAGGANNAVVYFGTDTATPGKRYTGTAHRHPNYGQDGLHHDLTVIVLSEDVADASARRIATTEEIDRATFVRAAGFGNSDFASTSGFGIKRMVDVPIASICCCNEPDPTSLGCDKKLELVAGFVGLGPDSCNGDSGGPVYVLVGSDARLDSAWAVAGATSRATNLRSRPCGDGGIYARLDQYLDFIRNIPGARF